LPPFLTDAAKEPLAYCLKRDAAKKEPFNYEGVLPWKDALALSSLPFIMSFLLKAGIQVPSPPILSPLAGENETEGD